MPRSALRRYFRHGLFPQLMVFEAVARRQSVTRAAEELHLAQPTVSTQLKLLSGKDELCLLPAPEDRPGLATNPAAVELLHLYAPAGHRLANARAIRLDSLAPEGLVLREPGSGPREALLAAFAASGISPAVRAELSSDETVAEAVAAGLGIGLLPEGEAHALSRAGAIVVLDVHGFPLRREWSIARLGAARLSLPAELFLREAIEGAEGSPVARQKQAVPA